MKKWLERLAVVLVMIAGMVVTGIVAAKRIIAAREAQLYEMVGRANALPDQSYVVIACKTAPHDDCEIERAYAVDADGEYDVQVGNDVHVLVKAPAAP